MKAIVRERYGSPEVLQLKEVAQPTPSEQEVLVRVQASSVNAWDWDLLVGSQLIVRLSGLFSPQQRILGGDIAGTVAAVGSGVSRFQPGQAVFGDSSGEHFGAFAEYAVAPEHALAPIPTGMTWEQAAALPQAGTMALQALRKYGEVLPGQRVLINGAGGGAGSLAVQLAKHYGARVTGVDRGSKLDFMRAQGAEQVFDFTQTDYTRTGEQYDLIVDMVARRTVRDYRRALKPQGAFVLVGGGVRTLIQVGLWGGERMGLLMYRPNRQDLETLGEYLAAGAICAPIERVYPLAETPAALRRVGEGQALGKVVIRVQEEAA